MICGVGKDLLDLAGESNLNVSQPGFIHCDVAGRANLVFDWLALDHAGLHSDALQSLRRDLNWHQAALPSLQALRPSSCRSNLARWKSPSVVAPPLPSLALESVVQPESRQDRDENDVPSECQQEACAIGFHLFRPFLAQ